MYTLREAVERWAAGDNRSPDSLRNAIWREIATLDAEGDPHALDTVDARVQAIAADLGLVDERFRQYVVEALLSVRETHGR